LHKPKNHIGWLLAIGIAILLYLLVESRQRSKQLDEALQQTTTPTIKPNEP
jgi:hypothetical protein